MPRTTVYIRDGDWDKWKLITNKAELISQAINRSIIEPVETKKGIKTRQTISSPEPAPVKKSGKVCKTHGVEQEICKMMKH